jgi:cation diffusion facilitator family transporter
MDGPSLPTVGREAERQPPRLVRYAWLSIATALATIVLKSAAYLVTDSVGLLSDAAESVVNLVAAIVALVALRVASRPADHNHHYGHGKAEYLSAALEGLMIFAAAALIMVSAVRRFLAPEPLTSVGVGLAVAIVASVLNGVVGAVLVRAGRRHRSATLSADGRHLLTDVWTSIGVVVGVLLVAVTGVERLDPIVAAAVGVNILVVGYRLVADSTVALLDEALPAEDESRLRAVLDGFATAEVAATDVRTRQSGRHRFVAFDLRVPGTWSVNQGHQVADRIERAVLRELPGIDVRIRLEPAPPPAPGGPAEERRETDVGHPTNDARRTADDDARTPSPPSPATPGSRGSRRS